MRPAVVGVAWRVGKQLELGRRGWHLRARSRPPHLLRPLAQHVIMPPRLPNQLEAGSGGVDRRHGSDEGAAAASTAATGCFRKAANAPAADAIGESDGVGSSSNSPITPRPLRDPIDLRARLPRAAACIFTAASSSAGSRSPHAVGRPEGEVGSEVAGRLLLLPFSGPSTSSNPRLSDATSRRFEERPPLLLPERRRASFRIADM